MLPKDPVNPAPREPVPKKTKGRPSNSMTRMPAGPDKKFLSESNIVPIL
jgi:hypothetical protein